MLAFPCKEWYQKRTGQEEYFFLTRMEVNSGSAGRFWEKHEEVFLATADRGQYPGWFFYFFGGKEGMFWQKVR